jgi:hypothetical protein
LRPARCEFIDALALYVRHKQIASTANSQPLLKRHVRDGIAPIAVTGAVHPPQYCYGGRATHART